MPESDKELKTIYESFVQSEGFVNNFVTNLKPVVDNVRSVIISGYEKGLDLSEIVADNIPKFIALAGILSSFVTMDRVYKMYKTHPEILQKHNQYFDSTVIEITDFLKTHPQILDALSKKK